MSPRRIAVKTAQALSLGLVLIGSLPASSSATDMKYWRWVDVWPWQDCDYRCTDLGHDQCNCFK